MTDFRKHYLKPSAGLWPSALFQQILFFARRETEYTLWDGLRQKDRGLCVLGICIWQKKDHVKTTSFKANILFIWAETFPDLVRIFCWLFFFLFQACWWTCSRCAKPTWNSCTSVCFNLLKPYEMTLTVVHHVLDEDYDHRRFVILSDDLWSSNLGHLGSFLQIKKFDWLQLKYNYWQHFELNAGLIQPAWISAR